MNEAAILLVPATWNRDDAVGISREVYDRFREAFMGGLQLAIMKTTPHNQIVAQAMLADGAHLANAHDWVGDAPQDGLGNPADYVLPIRLLYTYSKDLAVPREIVIKRVGDINDLDAYGFQPVGVKIYESLFDRYIENEGR